MIAPNLPTSGHLTTLNNDGDDEDDLVNPTFHYLMLHSLPHLFSPEPDPHCLAWHRVYEGAQQALQANSRNVAAHFPERVKELPLSFILQPPSNAVTSVPEDGFSVHLSTTEDGEKDKRQSGLAKMSADKLISFITNGNVEGPSKRREVAEFQRTRFLHDCVIPWVVAVHEEEANGARSKTKLQITYEITDLLLYNAIGAVLQDTYDDEEVEDTNAFGREFEMRKYAILEYQSRESGGRERQHKRMKFDTS